MGGIGFLYKTLKIKNMKKINFLWLVIILTLLPISFVSCSDDDEEGVGSTSELVGTWEIVSHTYQWKEDGIIIEEGTENDSNTRITFNEDGTCKGAEFYNDKWNWDWNGTWSYKNGKLSIAYPDSETETATVKELTSSKLVLEYIDKYTEDGTSYEDYEHSEYHKISN